MRGGGTRGRVAHRVTSSRVSDMVSGERRAAALRRDPRARHASGLSGPEAFFGADQSQRLATDLVTSQKKPRGFRKARGHPPSISPPLLTRAAAMEPRRSKRIKLSKEGDFGVLLGALMRDVPDLFEAEVLSKLDVKDHFRLAQVNKACRNVVYKLGPVEFMRSCDDGDRLDRLGSRRRVAVEEGRLDVLQWLWKHDGPLLTTLVLKELYKDLYYAGLHGHKHVLDWYFTLPRDGLDRRVVQALDYCGGACNGAAQGGKLELLKYLGQKGSIFSATTCGMAAGTGQLHVVKWLRENGCPWDESTPRIAAFAGHLSTLKWAHENGCPWDKETCSSAALGGELEILMWLRAHGCPWDEETCVYAAREGFGLLQWALRNGCPCNTSAVHIVVANQAPEALKMLHENGCPWDEEALDIAIECGAWTCLKYLVDNKCPGVDEEIVELYEEYCK